MEERKNQRKRKKSGRECEAEKEGHQRGFSR
jgi:hypothetical protein